MRMYHWVAWHRELARKIAEGGRDDLVEKIGLVTDDTVNLGKDPLSFFSFLRNSLSESNGVSEAVAYVFGLPKLPDPGELRNIIFPYASMSLVRYGDLFWHLFKQATEDDPHIDQEDWKAAMDIDGVEVGTLTQALFLVNPNFFLPVDSAVDACFPEGWRKEKEEKIKGDGGYAEYLSAQEEIKELFLGCEPYEIYTFLRWQKDRGVVSKDSKFFHISTNAHGHGKGDFWDKEVAENINFKENNWVFVGGAAPDGKGAWENIEGRPWKDIRNEVEEKGSRPYPLLDPKQGDIILVRTGFSRGRAIGIILKNDYDRSDGSGLNEKSRIHVLWINKSDSSLTGRVQWIAFAIAKKQTLKHFANAENFKTSFELMSQLTGKTIGSGDQVNQGRRTLNTILYGPPGTGKTYDTSHYAVAIIEGKSVEEVKKDNHEEVKKRFDKFRDNGQIEMVTFHQNYAYEDFIEGIRPVLKNNQSKKGQRQEVEYELSQGIFKEISKRAEEKKAENYVLIIDEINRGNIAKIFGELITLIEESRRLGETEETRVTLPYSGDAEKPFGVPNNLYIIGTMNTADRSIALLDTALRRRFEFKEMMPNSSQIKRDIEGVNIKDLLEAMNKRIRVLLDREHQIGHTYFFGVKDMKLLEKTFQTKIIPLLQEYFYDNWEKIDLVLNQNGFINGKSIDKLVDSDRFKKSDLIDKQEKIYEILPENDKGWNDPKSYINIYEGSNDAQSQEQNESGNEE